LAWSSGAGVGVVWRGRGVMGWVCAYRLVEAIPHIVAQKFTPCLSLFLYARMLIERSFNNSSAAQSKVKL
jgi:hypothetical protein